MEKLTPTQLYEALKKAGPVAFGEGSVSATEKELFGTYITEEERAEIAALKIKNSA